MRKAWIPLCVALALVTPSAFPVSQAQDALANAKMATVFIANYDGDGRFIGWGSGFFVDEGIVVTNKHVIDGGWYYKIFPTETNETVNLSCGKELTRSDVKVNLDDDAAYIRVYLDCPHGVVRFAQTDPIIGKDISILGYPSRGTLTESLTLSTVTGSVTGKTAENWLTTNAELHFGNSGGPVISDGEVGGMAVAKSVDAGGKFVEGYFVPGSVIIRGLLYANDSTFGYTPQAGQSNPAYGSRPAFPYGMANDPFDPPRTNRDATDADCRQSLGEGGEAIGYNGCRCKQNFHRDETGTTCVPRLEVPVTLNMSSSASSASRPRSRLLPKSLLPAPRSSTQSSEVGSVSSASSSSRSSVRRMSPKERLAARRLQRKLRSRSRSSFP